MALFPAVLDTCVLFPYYLADTLLSLAEAETYRPLWSPTILEELRRNLISKAELAPASVDQRLRAMMAAFPDAMVTEYQQFESALTNDKKDRHVLAVAVRASAETIVTANVKDFPQHALEPHGITAIQPDEFLLDQLDLYPGIVLDCLRRQVSTNAREPYTISELAGRLARCGAPNFASEILRY